MVIVTPIAPAIALVVALAIVVFALAIAIAFSIPGAVRRAAANVAIAVVTLPSFGVTSAMAGMEYTLIALIVAALTVASPFSPLPSQFCCLPTCKLSPDRGREDVAD